MRRFITQVHLWSALICSAYIVTISLTGSAVVLRREFGQWFAAPSFIAPAGEYLSEAALNDAIERAWPDWTITQLTEPFDERATAGVFLQRGEDVIERRFNPYTGEDLGAPYPWQLAAMSWLVDLHDNLLSGTTGRRINGIGGLAFLLIIVTGFILWWPRGRLLPAVTFSLRDKGQRLLLRLHSSLGFWTLPLLLIWALTAAYFGFPDPVENTIDYFDDDLMDFDRPGEPLLRALIAGHFGRFGPLPIRFVWMLAGAVPVALLVTGVLMWLRRRRTTKGRSV